MSEPYELDERWYDEVLPEIADWMRAQISEGVVTRGAWSDGLVYAAGATGEIALQATAHAVALERERVAAWLEQAGDLAPIAQQVRSGDHWKDGA